MFHLEVIGIGFLDLQAGRLLSSGSSSSPSSGGSGSPCSGLSGVAELLASCGLSRACGFAGA